MHEFVGHVSKHLVRRALENPDKDADRWRLMLEDVSASAWATISVTLFLFAFFYGAISYTLRLVFTLAAIEDADKSYLIPTVGPPAYKDIDNPAGGTPDAPLGEVSEDPEIVVMTSKPLTSSIRATVRHLHSVGGFTARWRGLSMAIAWGISYGLLDQFFSALFVVFALGIFGPSLGSMLARIAMARWEMGWTHMMIAQPSSEPWYRKTPPTNTWKNVWKATALNQLVAVVAGLIPMASFFFMGLHHKLSPEQGDEQYAAGDVISLLSLFLIWILSYWALILPANVALARVQASMLPSDQETIVPFDRTYGGRVVSQADDGSNVLSFADAWRSFSREARVRVLKLVLKTVAIQIAIGFLFCVILVVEICFFILPAINRESPDDGL